MKFSQPPHTTSLANGQTETIIMNLDFLHIMFTAVLCVCCHHNHKIFWYLQMGLFYWPSCLQYTFYCLDFDAVTWLIRETTTIASCPYKNKADRNRNVKNTTLFSQPWVHDDGIAWCARAENHCKHLRHSLICHWDIKASQIGGVLTTKWRDTTAFITTIATWFFSISEIPVNILSWWKKAIVE